MYGQLFNITVKQPESVLFLSLVQSEGSGYYALECFHVDPVLERQDAILQFFG